MGIPWKCAWQPSRCVPVPVDAQVQGVASVGHVGYAWGSGVVPGWASRGAGEGQNARKCTRHTCAAPCGWPVGAHNCTAQHAPPSLPPLLPLPWPLPPPSALGLLFPGLEPPLPCPRGWKFSKPGAGETTRCQGVGVGSKGHGAVRMRPAARALGAGRKAVRTPPSGNPFPSASQTGS